MTKRKTNQKNERNIKNKDLSISQNEKTETGLKKEDRDGKNSKLVNNHKGVLEKKNVKKDKNINQKNSMFTIDSSEEISKLIKIILLLIVVIVVFYGITVVVTKYQKHNIPDRNVNNDPAIIQYDEIMIGTMLKQSRKEYYVLIKADDSLYNSLLGNYQKSYSGKKDALKIYTANINDGLNQFYVGTSSYLKTDDLSKFRVSDITLIKVANQKIVEAYEGIDDVESALKKLLK